MGETQKKRGRPKKGITRSERLDIRLSPEEMEMLEFMCSKKGDTKTGIISSALRTQYNLSKFQL